MNAAPERAPKPPQVYFDSNGTHYELWGAGRARAAQGTSEADAARVVARELSPWSVLSPACDLDLVEDAIGDDAAPARSVILCENPIVAVNVAMNADGSLEDYAGVAKSFFKVLRAPPRSKIVRVAWASTQRLIVSDGLTVARELEAAARARRFVGRRDGRRRGRGKGHRPTRARLPRRIRRLEQRRSDVAGCRRTKDRVRKRCQMLAQRAHSDLLTLRERHLNAVTLLQNYERMSTGPLPAPCAIFHVRPTEDESQLATFWAAWIA